MFLFVKVTKTNDNIQLSSSNGESSPDIESSSIPYCVVIESSIYSNKSDDDAKPKYVQDSFSFHSLKSHIILQFNKMFLWRMIHIPSLYDSPIKQTDMNKMRTFFSRHMSDPRDIIIHVYPDNICYCDVNIPHFCLTIFDAFNQLYMDTIRKYNTRERVDTMLRECAKILCIVSRA